MSINSVSFNGDTNMNWGNLVNKPQNYGKTPEMEADSVNIKKKTGKKKATVGMFTTLTAVGAAIAGLVVAKKTGKLEAGNKVVGVLNKLATPLEQAYNKCANFVKTARNKFLTKTAEEGLGGEKVALRPRMKLHNKTFKFKAE